MARHEDAEHHGADQRCPGLGIGGLDRPADPEVVIVELVTHGTVTATGRVFAAPCIQVLRIRGRQILRFRDYFSPAGLEEAADPEARR